MNPLAYYSREDVQNELVRIAKDREIQFWFGKDKVGKRPDCVTLRGDIKEAVKNGMTSMHVSEERWRDPLMLQPGMSRKTLDELRIGWDLCLPGHEKIFVKINELWQLVEIKDFFNKLGFNDFGRYNIEKKDIKVLSLNLHNYKIEEDTVKDIVIRKRTTNENMFRVVVDDGNFIETSPDHPFLVFSSTEVITKSAKELNLNDYLLVPKNIDLNGLNELDLFSLLETKAKKDLFYKIKYKDLKLSVFGICNDKNTYSKLPPSLRENIGDNLMRAVRLNQRLNTKMALMAPSVDLKKIIGSSVFPIRVRNIIELPYEKDFYDLETKKNNNFLAGFGIFVHNCLDIDGKHFELSRMVTELIIEAFKFYEVKDYSVKFSGNKGFHIAVPFESFPEEVNGIKIKDYFPDGLRVISEFLGEKIKPFLIEKILKWKDVDTLVNEFLAGERAKLIKEEGINPFSLVDIDSILISSRHMFRAPYVFNEKSGLVSIIVEDIKNFKREDAQWEKVIVKPNFLRRENVVKGSARQLLIEAFDWYGHKKSKKDYLMKELKQGEKKELEISTVAIKESFFPPCINKLLLGVGEDGRKRAVFILINFLRYAGWDWNKIESTLDTWNEKNYEPLREGYIKAQISWARKQQNNIMPPNCSNEAYYKSLGICCPDSICSKVKNPVNYMLRKVAFEANRRAK